VSWARSLSWVLSYGAYDGFHGTISHDEKRITLWVCMHAGGSIVCVNKHGVAYVAI